MSTSGAYPVDVTTPVGALRSLVGDLGATNIDSVAHTADYAIWSDDDLQNALTFATDSPYRAAGGLYAALAARYVQTGRSIRTDDLNIDTRHRGKDLLEVSRAFFGLADSADATEAADFFEVAPIGAYTHPQVSRRGETWPELGVW